MTSQNRWATAVALAATGLAATVVVLVVLRAGGEPDRLLRGADPGTAVRFTLPLLRLAADTAATVCVGALVFAAWLSVPGPRGALGPRGYAATVTARRWALGWALSALGVALSTLAASGGGFSSLSGLFASGTSWSTLVAAVAAAGEPVAWLLVAVLAAGAHAALHRNTVVVVLGVAIAALWPPLATGHASSQTGHDLDRMEAGASARKLARVTVAGGGAAITGRRRCQARVRGWDWTFTRVRWSGARSTRARGKSAPSESVRAPRQSWRGCSRSRDR